MARGLLRMDDGGSATCFVGGNSASIALHPTGREAWSATSKNATDNNEALRRVLTAALLCLDGSEQLVEGSLHGEIRLKLEVGRRDG